MGNASNQAQAPPMHQHLAHLTFLRSAPTMMGREFAMMMTPPAGSRTTCLVTPCSQLTPQGPSPPQSRGFSIARDAGGYPDHPMKKGRKTSALMNWNYFL